MSMNELQKQTNANIQAKANLIWEIATHLVACSNPMSMASHDRAEAF